MMADLSSSMDKLNDVFGFYSALGWCRGNDVSLTVVTVMASSFVIVIYAYIYCQKDP